MRRYWKLLAFVPWIVAAVSYLLTSYVSRIEREFSFEKVLNDPLVRSEARMIHNELTTHQSDPISADQVGTTR